MRQKNVVCLAEMPTDELSKILKSLEKIEAKKDDKQ